MFRFGLQQVALCAVFGMDFVMIEALKRSEETSVPDHPTKGSSDEKLEHERSGGKLDVGSDSIDGFSSTRQGRHHEAQPNTTYHSSHTTSLASDTTYHSSHTTSLASDTTYHESASINAPNNTHTVSRNTSHHLSHSNTDAQSDDNTDAQSDDQAAHLNPVSLDQPLSVLISLQRSNHTALGATHYCPSLFISNNTSFDQSPQESLSNNETHHSQGKHEVHTKEAHYIKAFSSYASQQLVSHRTSQCPAYFCTELYSSTYNYSLASFASEEADGYQAKREESLDQEAIHLAHTPPQDQSNQEGSSVLSTLSRGGQDPQPR